MCISIMDSGTYQCGFANHSVLERVNKPFFFSSGEKTVWKKKRKRPRQDSNPGMQFGRAWPTELNQLTI